MSSPDEEFRYVFKISQYINYLVQHEMTVINGLNEIANYCPHFCKGVGAILADVNPTVVRSGNPFENLGKHVIEKEVLLMEHLEKSYKFYNYIKNKNVNESVLYSIVKQTLLGISIAQRKKKFTHYDLHSNNIMLKKCSKDLVFLYVLDENNQFAVSTRGYYPIIIDYGFSYIDNFKGGPLWQTFSYTDVGFTSTEFDPIADMKLFMIICADEINKHRGSKLSRTLYNISKNVFRKLNVQWDSGWDNVDGTVSDKVILKLEPVMKNSILFSDYEHYCLDIIQTLIIQPLKPIKTKDLYISFNAFIQEFQKIEQQISTPFYLLYILKGIVDSNLLP